MIGRDRAMAARLGETAERLGFESAAIDLIQDAFETAMEPRRSIAMDERAPGFLHPARTALILMDDVGIADPHPIAAALVTETRDEQLRPGTAAVACLGERVTGLVSAVPDPREEDGLLERLVSAEPVVLLIALAERLDHARHLHLRPSGEWEDYHRITCTAYAPAAGRADPVLHRRFRWWCRAFSRRLDRGV